MHSDVEFHKECSIIQPEIPAGDKPEAYFGLTVLAGQSHPAEKVDRLI